MTTNPFPGEMMLLATTLLSTASIGTLAVFGRPHPGVPHSQHPIGLGLRCHRASSLDA
jgi:hypothetical protein